MTSSRLVKYITLAATAVAAAIAPGGCMESRLESKWLDRAITIDGKAPEWAGQEAYYDETEGLKIGFFNDAKYLYIYLSTWHRSTQMQVLVNGLTVWFDAAGGTKQTFGVNYPMKSLMPGSTEMPFRMQAGGRPGMPGGRPSGEPSRPSSSTSQDNQQMLAGMLADAQKELQLVGLNNEPLASMPAADDSTGGIASMVDIANRTLIYELRIPLAIAGGTPYSLKAAPGAVVGVGIQTGRMEMPEMKGQAPSDMGDNPGGGPGGGFPGGGGGPGGGMGPPGGAPGGLREESLKLWFKVKLASGPAEAPQK